MGISRGRGAVYGAVMIKIMGARYAYIIYKVYDWWDSIICTDEETLSMFGIILLIRG
ncbi:MAG: hypothetical protein ACI8VC_002028 [Candidatus Endobugula sp.]|jgi:hypothetical protein